MSNTVYMVNPAGDLAATQATFEESFKQQQTWQVKQLVADFPAACQCPVAVHAVAVHSVHAPDLSLRSSLACLLQCCT